MRDELSDAFERTVDEGDRRLHRSWPELLATGTVGGLDLVIGVLALLIVRYDTHSETVSAVAFTIGFIAVTLANSELFTENFLVPVAALVAGKARWPALVRLWVFTLAMNLLGGWIGMAVVIGGLPKLKPLVLELALHYAKQGIGWESMATALLGGAIITLMTWMERSTEAMVGKLTAAVIVAFLLAAGPLNHSIVVSLEMFAALISGAPFGYLDWLGMLAWVALGNLLGGIGFVTVLRLVQVGQSGIERERD